MRVLKTMIALIMLACCGCMLTGPGTDSMSSIVVEDCSVRDVRKATRAVFQEKYYMITSDTERNVTFERAGTRDDRLRYARYEESLTMQVVVSFEDYNGGCLIRADAYAVRGTSRENQAVMKIARRPYQNLLKKVRKRCEVKEDE